jgi:hypothetical protein
MNTTHCVKLGVVTEAPNFIVAHNGAELMNTSIETLNDAWQATLNW